MDINELLTLVGRRWKLIVACVVLAVLGATAFSVLVTPQYQSGARLLVTAERDASRDPYSLSLLAGQRVKTYAELATSKPVLDAIAKRPGIKSGATELRNQIQAAHVPETFVIDVMATDDSAKAAQTLARTASIEASQYLTRLEEGGKARSGLEVRVSDPANLPTEPTSPRTTLNLLVASLLGLLVGLALAVLVESRVGKRVYDEDDLDDELDEEIDEDQDDEAADTALVTHDDQAHDESSDDRAVPAHT